MDTLYDSQVRVLFSADVPPNELFCSKPVTSSGDHSAPDDDARKLMDDLGVKDISAAIFSGEEEVFAFYRTLSRIAEMQTPAYWNAANV